MQRLDEAERELATHHLAVIGGFHPTAGDGAPEGCRTLLLTGPRGPGFWDHFKTSPEYRDGAPDPMDRWSARVLGRVAGDLGAEALFPFGGPPWRPFIGWAKRTGRVWTSPVTLLVHDRAGLMLSFRGALAVDRHLDLPAPPLATPCDGCARPCETACPVDALSADGYDTAACHAYLDTPAGAECMEHGCLARRACPVSQSHGRDPAQSAFHMRSFHP